MNRSQFQTLLARQGIYDKTGSIFAYELLYRNNDEEQANVDNTNEQAAVQATSSVIVQLFTNFNIDSVIGNKRAFINFTYSDLIHQIPNLLPKNRIFIEVLETVAIDPQLFSNLLELKNNGYQIALDDFVYKDELIPLIEIADIIKLDVLNQTKKEIAEQMSLLKGYKGKFLAEKIDNRELFNHCIDLGFDYFQGFFLNKPDNLKGQIICENKSHLIRVMAELNNEDISIERLEEMILQIPRLSYRILRISNSVLYYKGKKNDSLIDAIFRLGLVKIRSWTNLILLSSQPDTSSDLLVRTLIRAKMCELLAKTIKNVKPHEAYTVGILSSLDGMLNEPMPVLLDKIKLCDAFNDALLHYNGGLGKLLKFTMDYEQASFSQLENLPFDKNECTHFYLEGIEYANTIINMLPEN